MILLDHYCYFSLVCC